MTGVSTWDPMVLPKTGCVYWRFYSTHSILIAVDSTHFWQGVCVVVYFYRTHFSWQGVFTSDFTVYNSLDRACLLVTFWYGTYWRGALYCRSWRLGAARRSQSKHILETKHIHIIILTCAWTANMKQIRYVPISWVCLGSLWYSLLTTKCVYGWLYGTHLPWQGVITSELWYLLPVMACH